MDLVFSKAIFFAFKSSKKKRRINLPNSDFCPSLGRIKIAKSTL